MSSNVGLSTPRGSGTSGYVQRNSAFMKPRSAGYGAPYPPVSNATDRGFKQRAPDKQILEHDRRRMVEVKVMEERDRLEEENDLIERENKHREVRRGKRKLNRKPLPEKYTEEELLERGDLDPSEDSDPGLEPVLSEEEIEERCEALRAKLLKELEDESGSGSRGRSGKEGGGKMLPPRDRRNLKSYQVHELAEAKIEESERLRKALGIREDRETGEISSGRPDRRPRD